MPHHEKPCRFPPLLLACTALVLAQPVSAKTCRVFLLAGQSNMEGVGLAAQAPTNLLDQSRVLLYHSPAVRSGLPANQWNPLSPAGISPANFGPELAAAFRWAEAFPNETVALIKHARGGTKLTTETLPYETTGWHPGADPSDTAAFGVEFATFAATVTNALAAMRTQGDTPVLTGMLWVQGEADATSATAGAAYGTNLAHFVSRVRQQFDAPTLPVALARVLPYQTRPGSAAVRQAQADADQDSGVPGALPGVFTVRTEGLGVHTDAVHFDTAGQLALGTRLAAALLRRSLGRQPPTPETLAYWQLDEATGAPFLLDAAGSFHLDLQVSATAAAPLVSQVAQRRTPFFLDGSLPSSNLSGLSQSRATRRAYDDALDMRSTPWTFEAFFKNNAIGTQSVYEVIGGTRSALSQYHGWRVIMTNGKIRFFATANNGQTANVLSTARFDDGQTHHVAAVWDPGGGPSGKMRLYLDGSLKGETSGVGDLGDASTSIKLFAIGGNVSGTQAAPVINDSKWNGTLDEVRFTAAALEPEEFLIALDKGSVLRLTAVDPLDRIYTDRAPCEAPSCAHIPRGGRALLPFALRTALGDGSVAFTVETPVTESGIRFSGRVQPQVLRAVHVEANYGGCARTQAGVAPSKSVAAAVVRLAPFDMYEALTDQTALTLDGRRCYAVAVGIGVARDATPGIYSGRLTATLDGKTTATQPFTLQVYRATLPERQTLDAMHWLWPEPQNLTHQTPPPWWSEAHWTLLEASCRTLREFGDTVLFTPLLYGEHPLIPVVRDPAAADRWTFDFARFDRWAALSQRLGFRALAGQHVRNPRAVFVTSSVGGAPQPLGLSANDYQSRFLPAFYKALGERLHALGLSDRYYQSLWDEPKAEALTEYRTMAETCRRHLPEAQILEALNRAYDAFADCVDVPAWWYGTVRSRDWPTLLAQQAAAGKSHWIYYACTPQPPYPNTHLDTPLWRCRALPWVADYCRAKGILHWAANAYRGADPYAGSIGPLPNGSTAPGHPPGDNWLFYPTGHGLAGSLRMAAFQQGLEDIDLLACLRRHDAKAADRLARDIVRVLVLDYKNHDIRSDYADVPLPYHTARQRLLELLDPFPQS